jgi:hypothetical protein
MSIASHRLAGFSENRAHLDFYPTPEWATEALFNVEKFEGTVLEPACGNGAMVKVIERYNTVIGKDVIYGNDFLEESQTFDNVITNPPFKLASQFVYKGKQVARMKLALFLKLCFLEGVGRQSMFKEANFPLARVHVFSKRVTFHPEGIEDRKRSGTMAFAWFIWDQSHKGEATLSWI